VPGRGVGTGLGFPTANLKVDSRKVLPRGVFAMRAAVLSESGRPGGATRWRAAVGNIGERPTFGKGETTFEVHFLEPVRDLRKKRIWVQLVARLRAEKKFSGVEGLKKAIAHDIARARRLLARSGPP
jgi:riboflavin kinase / FMN adenylyltransferase